MALNLRYECSTMSCFSFDKTTNIVWLVNFNYFNFNTSVFIFFQWCFVLAALFVITAGVWFYFITKSNRVMTYPATVLLGFGFSAMLVNALSFATELIGDDKVSSMI